MDVLVCNFVSVLEGVHIFGYRAIPQRQNLQFEEVEKKKQYTLIRLTYQFHFRSSWRATWDGVGACDAGACCGVDDVSSLVTVEGLAVELWNTVCSEPALWASIFARNSEP